MFESIMPGPDRLHEIAVASDRTVARVRERILELLQVATGPVDGADESGDCDRLQACFCLEPYGVFPAGALPTAPTEDEYAEYRALLIGEVQRIPPERRGPPPRPLTLAQIQADDFSALDT